MATGGSFAKDGASAGAVKAGETWVAIRGDDTKLREALDHAEGHLKGFARDAKGLTTGLGGTGVLGEFFGNLSDIAGIGAAAGGVGFAAVGAGLLLEHLVSALDHTKALTAETEAWKVQTQLTAQAAQRAREELLQATLALDPEAQKAALEKQRQFFQAQADELRERRKMLVEIGELLKPENTARRDTDEGFRRLKELEFKLGISPTFFTGREREDAAKRLADLLPKLDAIQQEIDRRTKALEELAALPAKQAAEAAKKRAEEAKQKQDDLLKSVEATTTAFRKQAETIRTTAQEAEVAELRRKAGQAGGGLGAALGGLGVGGIIGGAEEARRLLELAQAAEELRKLQLTLRGLNLQELSAGVGGNVAGAFGGGRLGLQQQLGTGVVSQLEEANKKLTKLDAIAAATGGTLKAINELNLQVK